MKPLSEDVKLRNAVELMDCLADEALSEISAIAKLALIAMETPDGYRFTENIAQALRAIWDRADTTRESIGYHAEEVGCGYTNEARARRLAAVRKATEEAKS